MQVRVINAAWLLDLDKQLLPFTEIFFHTGVAVSEVNEIFSVWCSTLLLFYKHFSLIIFSKMLFLIFFSIFSRRHMKSFLKSPIKCPLAVESRIVIDIGDRLIRIKQETAGIV